MAVNGKWKNETKNGLIITDYGVTLGDQMMSIDH